MGCASFVACSLLSRTKRGLTKHALAPVSTRLIVVLHRSAVRMLHLNWYCLAIGFADDCNAASEMTWCRYSAVSSAAADMTCAAAA